MLQLTKYRCGEHVDKYGAQCECWLRLGKNFRGTRFWWQEGVTSGFRGHFDHERIVEPNGKDWSLRANRFFYNALKHNVGNSKKAIANSIVKDRVKAFSLYQVREGQFCPTRH